MTPPGMRSRKADLHPRDEVLQHLGQLVFRAEFNVAGVLLEEDRITTGQ